MPHLVYPFSMKRLITSLCLTISLAIGSFGVGWSGDKGTDAFQRGDYITAFKQWKPLAEKGNKFYQYNLGLLYNLGKGVPQDYKEAFKWFSLSAYQGFEAAQYDLGVMYYKGVGTIQDYIYAHMWLNISAANGHEQSPESRDKD